jgi:hypothetical protein
LPQEIAIIFEFDNHSRCWGGWWWQAVAPRPENKRSESPPLEKFGRVGACNSLRRSSDRLLHFREIGFQKSQSAQVKRLNQTSCLGCVVSRSSAA